MPRSGSKAKTGPTQTARARQRWNWRRVFGGMAELLRNFALIAFGAPFVEPLVTSAPINTQQAVIGGLFGLAFLAFALIFDHERSD